MQSLCDGTDKKASHEHIPKAAEALPETQNEDTILVGPFECADRWQNKHFNSVSSPKPDALVNQRIENKDPLNVIYTVLQQQALRVLMVSYSVDKNLLHSQYLETTLHHPHSYSLLKKESYQLSDPNLETKHCCKKGTFFTLTELRLPFTLVYRHCALLAIFFQVMAEEDSEYEVDDDVADLEDRREALAVRAKGPVEALAFFCDIHIGGIFQCWRRVVVDGCG
nr:hypothetical protein [Tanacetum cinerariifolium]